MPRKQSTLKLALYQAMQHIDEALMYCRPVRGVPRHEREQAVKHHRGRALDRLKKALILCKSNK